MTMEESKSRSANLERDINKEKRLVALPRAKRREYLMSENTRAYCVAEVEYMIMINKKYFSALNTIY